MAKHIYYQYHRSYYGTGRGVRAKTLDANQLRRVARMDEVLFIDTWWPPESDMDQVRQMPPIGNGVPGGADYIEAVAGYTGLGVAAEVMDAGVRATHVDFAGSLLAHGPQSVAAHGTSTTGINFGKGISNPRARGMVPDAQGISAFYGGLTNRYQHTAQLLDQPYLAVYQSNSWGSGSTRDYTTVTSEMDDILFHLDFVILQSQSNTGSQLSRPQAWAKNIVSIGGLRHYHNLNMETHCWCRSASIGPAADGRIKPDLAHFNDLVFTTTSSSDTAYTSSFGGTSAATPIVAGHFGVFFQMWHNGIFGNTPAMTVFESRPHMTTAKAMMINTARQWTFNGDADDRTRVHQGWGMPDLANLYNLRDRILVVDESDVLLPLGSMAYMVTVTAGGPPLKATMVYKDPPGNTSSTLHRINDLDLKVTSPSGAVYWGNNGLLAEMWSVPGGAADRLNTVENVFVQNPEGGIWMVEVMATEINEDSHLQTPAVDADYALVVSGLAPRVP